MTKTPTILLGAAMLSVGLASPMAAKADSNDRALAFIVGAAVGHAVSDRAVHVAPVHRRHHGYGPKLRHLRHRRWQQRHHDFHRGMQREHRRFHGHGRYDHKRGHRRHDHYDRFRDQHRDHRRNRRYRG